MLLSKKKEKKVALSLFNVQAIITFVHICMVLNKLFKPNVVFY